MTARQQRKKSKQPQEEAVLPLTVASQERLERSRVALTVAVDSEVVRRETDRSYQALGNRYQVPGFRRGKAPHAILKTYLGEERIRQEMIESLLPKAYRQAVLDSGVEIIPDADPDVEILEATLDGTVTFKATVPVAPTVELGDYQSIHIERQPVEITDAQVDETIERLRRARAAWSEAPERPVEQGDRTTIDIHCEVETDVVVDQHDLTFVIGDGTLTQELEGGLIGTRPGEVRSIIISLPPDYREAQYAGKDAAYTILVKKVEQPILPELNEEFLKEAAGVDTVEALHERAREQLLASAQEAEQERVETAAVQQLIERSKLEYPVVLVEQQLDRSLESFATNLARQGFLPDRYLEQMGTTPQQLREDWRPRADQMVQRRLVLQRLAEAENLEPTEEQILDELVRSTNGISREQLPTLLSINPQLREAVRLGARERLALQRLVQLTVTEQAPASAPSAEAAEEDEGAAATSSDIDEVTPTEVGGTS